MDRDAALQAVRDTLRAAVTAEDPATRPVYAWLRYHLGWADADGHPIEARAGKGIRPRVCLLACEAVGGDPQLAVPAAAAVELTHEFSLIHDDIEDGDTLRRGRAALWTQCGSAQGINAGDLLFALARRQLVAGPLAPSTQLALVRRYDAACIGLAEGQFLDLAFEQADRIAVDDYLAMVARKTGALLEAAAAMGALAGGATAAEVEALADYGQALGIAFQIQDDVLGLWGDPERTGKPVGADLQRGKKSLPVLLARAGGALGEEAVQPPPGGTSPEHAARIAHHLADRGYRAEAVALAGGQVQRAQAALEALPRSAARDALAALASAAVGREA
jgi:geranylgeranyl diphosphate synthase type I